MTKPTVATLTAENSALRAQVEDLTGKLKLQIWRANHAVEAAMPTLIDAKAAIAILKAANGADTRTVKQVMVAGA